LIRQIPGRAGQGIPGISINGAETAVSAKGSLCVAERGIGVDFFIPFGGQALNAVDAKGRVSLPADLRTTVERRAALAKENGLPVDDKVLHIAEDEELPCLVGFDETEQFNLARRLAELRAADPGGGSRKSLVRRDRGTETFAPAQRVVFDKAGRMVLPGFLRDFAEIGDFAFFTGNGDNFDIWSPMRAHAHFTAIGEPRLVRILEYLCKEKGVEL
jgi:MraZ protein